MNNKRENGKFVKSAIYVDRVCVICKSVFNIKKSSLKYGRGIYCSKKCSDEHKKLTMLGSNNGMYGKKESYDHKRDRLKKIWDSPNIKDNIKQSLYKFKDVNGYWPGSDSESVDKRKKTMVAKYGVDHNWKIKKCRELCDITTLKLYGKTAMELMIDALHSQKETKIEKIVRILLEKYKVNYIQYNKILFGDSYKEYDFFIPEKLLLIEADGDFWHGNPKHYSSERLCEIQKFNISNDVIKTKLAVDMKYSLIRFWESDILEDRFEEKIVKTLNL